MVKQKNNKHRIGIHIITLFGIILSLLIFSCLSTFNLYYHGNKLDLSDACEYTSRFYEESDYDQEIKEICHSRALALTSVNNNITNTTDIFIATMASIILLISLMYHESATRTNKQ